MKTTVSNLLTVMTFFFASHAFAQTSSLEDGKPKLTTAVFARYASVHAILEETPPRLDVIQIGVAMKLKKNIFEAAYLHNQTLSREGFALYYKRVLWAKPLPKKFLIASPLITEVVVLPGTDKPTIFSGSVGLGFSVNKTFGPVTLSVINAGFGKALIVQDVAKKTFLEYRGIVNLKYTF